jgi:GTP cyclohydrolase I
MSNIYKLSWESVFEGLEVIDKKGVRVFGVPRGGMIAAGFLKHATNVHTPEIADIILDDIVDSGRTRDYYKKNFPNTDFVALVDKTTIDKDLGWVVFPWERDEEASAEDICMRLLQYIGEDPFREGLQETPKRFLKAWQYWTSGYKQNPAELLKVFEDGAENYDQMVVVKDIPIFSHCEHHLAAIFGVAHIGYIPNGKILGLSKLARLADMYARRLQVQERLTNQIADALETHLQPLGVAVVIRARHFCMESRGVQKFGSETVSSAMRGVLLTKPETRAEFMTLIK